MLYFRDYLKYITWVIFFRKFMYYLCLFSYFSLNFYWSWRLVRFVKSSVRCSWFVCVFRHSFPYIRFSVYVLVLRRNLDTRLDNKLDIKEKLFNSDSWMRGHHIHSKSTCIVWSRAWIVHGVYILWPAFRKFGY